jgi:TRAP-type mannitol/chloroaromatic compound transport system permease small subunit
MRPLLRWLEVLSRVAEIAAATSILLLVCMVFLNVMLRYFFNLSAMAVQELQFYFYALGFLLAMAPTLRADGHVRIDIFYARFPQRWKRWVDGFGTLVFLLPFALLVLWASYDFVAYSFSIREASPNPGGLPALYFFKAFIPLSFALLVAVACGLLWSRLHERNPTFPGKAR